MYSEPFRRGPDVFFSMWLKLFHHCSYSVVFVLIRFKSFWFFSFRNILICSSGFSVLILLPKYVHYVYVLLGGNNPPFRPYQKISSKEILPKNAFSCRPPRNLRYDKKIQNRT